ncbi:MAG: 2,4-diaminopentanoate dehydrogenase [Bacillota bacterium]
MTVRVLIWGLGAMGSGMAKLISQKQGIEMAGAIVRNTHGAANLRQYLGDDSLPDVPVVSEPSKLLGHVDADLALICTASFTKEVFEQLQAALGAGLNVITIAEQMANPWVDEPELAQRLDTLARIKGVTIVGTGINPGFVLDTLIIALTGVCAEVRSLKAARINDLSPFGPTVMMTQGVGTTPEGFAQGLKDGSIVGHVGFRESMGMIADALGWNLDEIRETREPIISKTHRETPYVTVEPGQVAGCRHIAQGFVNGQVKITLEHPQQVRPESEGVATGDYIWIDGTPPLNLTIKPEIPGGIGTIAMAVNLIPLVLQAAPGLRLMTDLPIPRAVMGDLTKTLAEIEAGR